MNEPDGYALEEALRLKEKHGGEVVVVSLGPERAKQTIKEALAKGADRAIHVVDDGFYHPRSARLRPSSLAAAIAKESPDLVLTGLQSDDHGFGQTGVLLAELLGLPHATIIMQIEVVDGKLQAQARTRSRLVPVDGTARFPPCSPSSPASTKPRYATLKGIMAAKKKEIRPSIRANRSASPHEPTQKLERIYVPQKTKKTEFLTGTPRKSPRSCSKNCGTKRA